MSDSQSLEFYDSISQLLSDVQGLIRHNTENSVCLAVTRLESGILASQLSIMDSAFRPILNLMEQALEVIVSNVNQQNLQTREVGRPKIEIASPQLEYLLSMGFQVTQIASFFKVSRYTIMRRLKDYNLSATSSYSQITDEDLEALIVSLLLNYPNTGYKRMKGYLLARNVKLTDHRVRVAMRTADPAGVYERTIRRNRIIRRRVYFVKYSNQLWHIDGNLKLIRWGIVIRCGIDGKSRAVTYISASSNNRADTHLESFLCGVARYGVPLRTRSDKGGENVLIAKFMIENRGAGRSSHICGRSVHNQRIERYWRDVFEGCTSTYYHLFSRLEEDGLLNIDNPLHLWVLHYIFLPRLNWHLLAFINAWNNHPLSTENNNTPNKLMLLNLPPPDTDIILTPDELMDFEFSCEDITDLGRFDEISNFEEDQSDSVILTTAQRAALDNIDLTMDSNSFGYDIYEHAVNVLYGDIQ